MPACVSAQPVPRTGLKQVRASQKPSAACLRGQDQGRSVRPKTAVVPGARDPAAFVVRGRAARPSTKKQRPSTFVDGRVKRWAFLRSFCCKSARQGKSAVPGFCSGPADAPAAEIQAAVRALPLIAEWQPGKGLSNLARGHFLFLFVAARGGPDGCPNSLAAVFYCCAIKNMLFLFAAA